MPSYRTRLNMGKQFLTRNNSYHRLCHRLLTSAPQHFGVSSSPGSHNTSRIRPAAGAQATQNRSLTLLSVFVVFWSECNLLLQFCLLNVKRKSPKHLQSIAVFYTQFTQYLLTGGYLHTTLNQIPPPQFIGDTGGSAVCV